MEWPLTGREAELDRAWETVESGTGIAILGPAGVGKSRLLHELVGRAEASGKAVVEAVASESTRGIPFAPFVELLPEGPTQDRLLMLQSALRTLDSHTGQRGLLLAVDDAHHLDPASLALLISVVTSSQATVSLTARTGEPMEADLVDLWTNGVIERLDLTPLERGKARALVESALGPIDDDLEADLWRLAGGNVLLLHEIVEGSASRSIVEDKNGVFHRTGPLADSDRLTDLVQSRLRSLSSDVRASMDLVAVGAPIPLRVARTALGEGLGRLEDWSLIDTADSAAGGMVVIPAHPLYGEILESSISQSRKSAALRSLVEACLKDRPSVDPLRAAVWQRDSGDLVSPELAVAGAATALVRHDPALCEDLVRPLAREHDQAAMLLGRAFSYQHRFEEAEGVMSGIDSGDPELAGELASARAHNLAYGLGRVSEAVTLLEEAAEIVDDVVRAKLDAERGTLAAIRGDFTDAKAAGWAVVANRAASPPAKAVGYVSLVLSLAMTADCDGFEEIVDEAYVAARTAKEEVPLAEDQVGVMEFSALFTSGRIEEACALAVRSEARVSGSALHSTWLGSLSIGQDLSGQQRKGLEAALEARKLIEEADPFGLEPQARGLTALARGQLGDEDAIEDIEGIEFEHPDPRLSIWVDRGRVWATAAKGDVSSAAEMAARRGADAIDRQHVSWGALLLHDAVRLGHPAEVLDVLVSLRNSRGAHLINTLVDHAELLSAEDGRGLLAVARSLGQMGAPLLAAEAAAQAAMWLTEEEATLAVCFSMGWEQKCQDPRTPALTDRRAVVSERQFEVALAAASGLTSPEISERLFISVRTVDNHLRSVYRKLDIGGRDELAELFAPIL